MKLKKELVTVKEEIRETESERKSTQQRAAESNESVSAFRRSVETAEKEAGDANGRKAKIDQQKQELEATLKVMQDQIDSLTREREAYAAKYLK